MSPLLNRFCLWSGAVVIFFIILHFYGNSRYNDGKLAATNAAYKKQQTHTRQVDRINRDAMESIFDVIDTRQSEGSVVLNESIKDFNTPSVTSPVTRKDNRNEETSSSDNDERDAVRLHHLHDGMLKLYRNAGGQ